MNIAVAVHSSQSGDLAGKIEAFLDELSKCGPHNIFVGGYWGYMRNVVDEALKRGMRVVAILPIEREDVELPKDAIVVKTGCEFRCRSVMLVRSADVLVALGGGAGTMIEIAMAYAMGKPVFVLKGTGLATDKLEAAYPEYLDERNSARVVYEADPKRLASLVCSARPTASALEVG
ncbi:MAG: LOG family protein [Thermoproteus sp. AZ2]|jgi:uncharacterized protein (TIGR00725 family)|uniref:LOG family protein n=1 Tax=Thermoproteus sp. AZ2 TaxID=1609232 RepID=A0ACC6UZN1_9CREN|nr:MAG: hypothetical protein TU35_03160 [Thermoproteus sp. AZ2]